MDPLDPRMMPTRDDDRWAQFNAAIGYGAFLLASSIIIAVLIVLARHA